MGVELEGVYKLEERLRKELEQSDLFKDWQSVKNTINLLQKNGHSSNEMASSPKEDFKIPLEFNDDLTWREKVLFAMGQIKNGFISDIIKELRKQGVKDSEEFLHKRVSTTASNLKKDGLLKGKKIGKQAKYSL